MTGPGRGGRQPIARRGGPSLIEERNKRVSYRYDNAFEAAFKHEMGQGCAGCVGLLIWIVIIEVLITVFGRGISPSSPLSPSSPPPSSLSPSR